MKKKKGFTLIELLAVIVILAIIALIATPLVLNIIKKAKRGAFMRSVDSVIKAGNIFYLEKQIDGINGETKFECINKKCTSTKMDSFGEPYQLDIDGDMGEGYVLVSYDGEVELLLEQSGMCAYKSRTTSEITYTNEQCENIEIKEDETRPTIRNINTSKAENSITVVVNAVDVESGISKYEYSINGSEYKESSNTYTFNELSEGTYTIKIKVTNGVNLYTEEETEIIIEKAKPVCPTPIITIENKENWTTSKKVTIDYGNVEGCIGKYSLDGSNFNEGTNITVNENTNIYAINEGGETTSTSQEEITTIDNTNPNLNITGVSSTTKSIDITYSSSDEQSGIKNTTCIYGETNTYGKTGTIEGNKCKINNLKNNTTYYYKITTENKAGLTKEQEGNTTTGEFSNISITPSSENYEKSKTYTITGETNGATIEYKITNGSLVKQEWTNYTKPILVDYASSEENKTVIYARLNDGINTSSEISIEETKIDVSGPSNITLSSNGNSNYNKSLNVTVTLQDGNSGLQAGSIKYGWSTSNTTAPSSYTTVSTSATTGTSATTFIASGSNLTGSYYLWVVPVNYKDKAGNSNTATVKSTGTFNFDNTVPTLTLGTVTSTTNSITIPISTNSDSHSGIKSTTCVYGTSTSYGKTGTISGSTCTISGLNSSTTYYYKVTSIDNATNSTSKTGNMATKASIQGTPTITASWPNTTSIRVAVSGVTIDSSDTISYRYSINDAVKQDWTTATSYTFTGLTAGSNNKVKIETRATTSGALGNSKEANIYAAKTASSTSTVSRCSDTKAYNDGTWSGTLTQTSCTSTRTYTWSTGTFEIGFYGNTYNVSASASFCPYSLGKGEHKAKLVSATASESKDWGFIAYHYVRTVEDCSVEEKTCADAGAGRDILVEGCREWKGYTFKVDGYSTCDGRKKSVSSVVCTYEGDFGTSAGTAYINSFSGQVNPITRTY